MSNRPLDDMQCEGPLIYPFSALHGQSSLQLALLLVAVDPRIGGVLIEGARGTAKTTSARALAEILPQGDFVNLPLGASEEHLTGSLDLEIVLQQGKSSFRPGLLARAHKGVLYVDEINLLADVLVDLLLDVCSSGMNRVERDGVSHQHAADIVLVGTMNPEEGELRPQLLDRFGLFVNADESIAIDMRQRIVRSRMAFDDDPAAFKLLYADQQKQRMAQLVSARANLSKIAFSDHDHERVARICHEAHVDGVRADLVMLRASRAMAALEGRLQISAEDIDAVAEMVLAHRRNGRTESTGPQATGKESDHDSQADSVEDEYQSEADDIGAGNTQAEQSQAGSQSQEPGQATADQSNTRDSSPSGTSRGEPERMPAQSPGSGSDSNTESDSGLGEDAQWGAMPAQSVPVHQVAWPSAGTGGAKSKKP